MMENLHENFCVMAGITSNADCSQFLQGGKNMGKSDAIGKKLMCNNTYFADAFNAGLFGGETLIDSTNLSEIDPAEIELDDPETGTDTFFNKYRAIFEYFDACLLGLTATPKKTVHQSTYEFFDMKNNMPTDV